MLQKREQVLLSRLPEGESIQGKGVADSLVALVVAAEGKLRYVPLDCSWSWVHPVGEQVVGSCWSGGGGGVECRVPRVAGLRAERIASVGCGDVPADGVALLSRDAALPLLEVHRTGWRIPVDNCVTPPVEVHTFLADGRGGKDERPERAVERSA